MHLVIYGSVKAGRLVVNADGVRVTFAGAPDAHPATWTASSPVPGGLSLVQQKIAAEVAPLFDVLFPPNLDRKVVT